MSTQYPILDNRPIDQWKVTELKEELKRRKITTRGLKDDLIKRLDEAIRNERESAKEIHKGSDCDHEPQVKCEDADTKNTRTEMVENTRNHDENKTQKVEDDGGAVAVDVDDTPVKLSQEKVQDGEPMDTDSVGLVEEPSVLPVSLETNITYSQNVVAQLESSRQELQNNEIQMENGELKPSQEDQAVVLNIFNPNNQVSEVSPVLGIQVKCESISTDSVSINEKNELKDNLNSDNVHLELEVGKPEMVEPSSSEVPSNGGDILPLYDQELRENMSSIQEMDDISATNVDLSKKIDSTDAGSSEKLNLDRSSGDDSMEEDVLESKQIDSKHNSDEVGNQSELTGVHVLKEERSVGETGAGLCSEKEEGDPVENKTNLAVPAEKRRFEDQVFVGNNEPPKRQRRWNSESLKVPELQISNLTPSTTPKDALQSTFSKRNFARSDSTLSIDTPKERVVPPSPKPPSNSLRIDRFVRPFTLKAVQDLLAKTGTVCSFWMDHIKTHCYVTYSSVDEAIETRNAVYNLQWPLNGGRLLVAEFVDPQEVKMRVEAPVQPGAPVSTSPTTPAAQPQPSPRQHVLRQQLPLASPLPPPPPISDPPTARERLPPPPPLPKKPDPPIDPPIVTLDDLFRKTRATPRIYYLPLSEEQVGAKVAARGKNT